MKKRKTLVVPDLMAALQASLATTGVPAACPDGGTCHHACPTADCFRVAHAGPLSVTGTDDWRVVLQKTVAALRAENARLAARSTAIPQFASLADAARVAAIVVHAQEYLSPTGHEMDAVALRALVASPEVHAWLAQFEPALLPLKRGVR